MADDAGAGRTFGRFRLVGGRYERAGLPVATSAELHRYERLVVTVARSLYFRDHPRRQRAPRGFDAALDLRIAAVEPGSVVPVLRRGRAEEIPELDLGHDYFERARRLINEAFGSIDSDGVLPSGFPVEALPDLATLGRGLAVDEQIELSGDGEPVVRVTQDTRRSASALANADAVVVELVLMGQVTGLRSTPQQFDLLLTGGQRVEGTYVDPEVWKDLHAFEGYRERAPYASLSVVARMTITGEVLAITDVLGVEAALPPEWADRVAELGRLRVGWLLEDTSPPSRASLDFTEETLLACLDEQLPRPAIYPSMDGGVQLEWKREQRSVEVEISNDEVVRFFAFDPAGDRDVERELTRDLDELIELVQEHV